MAESSLDIGTLAGRIELEDLMSSVLEKVDARLRDLGVGVEKANEHMVKAATIGAFLGNTYEKLAEKAVEFAREIVNGSVLAGAKLEELAMVSRFLGTNMAYTSEFVDQLSEKIEKSGITGLEARNAIIQLEKAHVDLSKAAELSSVAQNMAVMSGRGSSETYGMMIRSITTMNSQMIRLSGFTLTMDKVLEEYTRTTGKSGDALGLQAKQGLLVNAMIKEGAEYAGLYAMAMGTANKQLGSSTRVWEQVGEVIGTTLLPFTTLAIETWYKFGTAVRDTMTQVDVALKPFTASAGATLTKITASISTFAADALPRVSDGIKDLVAYLIHLNDKFAITDTVIGAAKLAWAALQEGVHLVTTAVTFLIERFQALPEWMKTGIKTTLEAAAVMGMYAKAVTLVASPVSIVSDKVKSLIQVISQASVAVLNIINIMKSGAAFEKITAGYTALTTAITGNTVVMGANKLLTEASVAGKVALGIMTAEVAAEEGAAALAITAEATASQAAAAVRAEQVTASLAAMEAEYAYMVSVGLMTEAQAAETLAIEANAAAKLAAAQVTAVAAAETATAALLAAGSTATVGVATGAIVAPTVVATGAVTALGIALYAVGVPLLIAGTAFALWKLGGWIGEIHVVQDSITWLIEKIPIMGEAWANSHRELVKQNRAMKEYNDYIKDLKTPFTDLVDKGVIPWTKALNEADQALRKQGAAQGLEYKELDKYVDDILMATYKLKDNGGQALKEIGTQLKMLANTAGTPDAAFKALADRITSLEKAGAILTPALRQWRDDFNLLGTHISVSALNAEDFTTAAKKMLTHENMPSDALQRLVDRAHELGHTLTGVASEDMFTFRTKILEVRLAAALAKDALVEIEKKVVALKKSTLEAGESQRVLAMSLAPTPENEAYLKLLDGNVVALRALVPQIESYVNATGKMSDGMRERYAAGLAANKAMEDEGVITLRAKGATIALIETRKLAGETEQQIATRYEVSAESLKKMLSLVPRLDALANAHQFIRKAELDEYTGLVLLTKARVDAGVQHAKQIGLTKDAQDAMKALGFTEQEIATRTGVGNAALAEHNRLLVARTKLDADQASLETERMRAAGATELAIKRKQIEDGLIAELAGLDKYDKNYKESADNAVALARLKTDALMTDTAAVTATGAGAAKDAMLIAQNTWRLAKAAALTGGSTDEAVEDFRKKAVDAQEAFAKFGRSADSITKGASADTSSAIDKIAASIGTIEPASKVAAIGVKGIGTAAKEAAVEMDRLAKLLKDALPPEPATAKLKTKAGDEVIPKVDGKYTDKTTAEKTGVYTSGTVGISGDNLLGQYHGAADTSKIKDTASLFAHATTKQTELTSGMKPLMDAIEKSKNKAVTSIKPIGDAYEDDSEKVLKFRDDTVDSLDDVQSYLFDTSSDIGKVGTSATTASTVTTTATTGIKTGFIDVVPAITSVVSATATIGPTAAAQVPAVNSLTAAVTALHAAEGAAPPVAAGAPPPGGTQALIDQLNANKKERDTDWAKTHPSVAIVGTGSAAAPGSGSAPKDSAPKEAAGSSAKATSSAAAASAAQANSTGFSIIGKIHEMSYGSGPASLGILQHDIAELTREVSEFKPGIRIGWEGVKEVQAHEDQLAQLAYLQKMLPEMVAQAEQAKIEARSSKEEQRQDSARLAHAMRGSGVAVGGEGGGGPLTKEQRDKIRTGTFGPQVSPSDARWGSDPSATAGPITFSPGSIVVQYPIMNDPRAKNEIAKMIGGAVVDSLRNKGRRAG